MTHQDGADIGPRRQHTERPSRPKMRESSDRSGYVGDVEHEHRVLRLIRETVELHHEALDDPEIMLLLAEGQTNLLEAVDCLLSSDLEDDALIQGLKAAKDTMSARLHRLEERRKSRRAILEQTLMLLECKSLQRPTATLVLTERPPALLIEEEAQIPAQYFDLKPVLNRRRAKEALEAGEIVAGARLSSSVLTLTLRRR